MIYPTMTRMQRQYLICLALDSSNLVVFDRLASMWPDALEPSTLKSVLDKSLTHAYPEVFRRCLEHDTALDYSLTIKCSLLICLREHVRDNDDMALARMIDVAATHKRPEFVDCLLTQIPP